jgi:hypothetical protein
LTEKKVSAVDQTSSARPSRSFAISEAQTAYFREFGFAFLDHITSPTEVASMRAAIEGLFEKKTVFRDGALINLLGADDDPDAPYLPQLQMPHHYLPELRETDFFANASAIARRLLGERAEFMADNVILKPAIIGPPTPWHQDESYRNPAFEHKEISIWLPLQLVDKAAGALAFIPKSHLGEVLPHRRTGGEYENYALECCGEFDAEQAVTCAVPVGSCSVHAVRTIHGSGPNLSNQGRYAYILIFRAPPVGALGPRQLPWLAYKQPPRMWQERAWPRTRRKLLVLWRKIKRSHPAEYKGMLGRRVWTIRHWIRMKCRR